MEGGAKQHLKTQVGLLQSRFLVEGDVTKHFSVKKRVFSEKGGGNSVNKGFGKDFYKKAIQ